MQQLQAFSLQRSAELADARNIAAWPVKAGNEAQLDRVDATGENDWNRRVAALAAIAEAGPPVATITAT